MDGILNIDKAPGVTSFGVVAAVKKLTGERHVGHAGTLDPDATGVLPVCLGRGTRIIEFLQDSTKSYRAEIEFGTTTDTYDGSGKVMQHGDALAITREQVESALASFQGEIEQTPPPYSAVKYHGRPLYEWARSGVAVERKSRLARVYQIQLTGWQPPLMTVEVICGKGTYIRSIAHDLGQTLGCGAYLKHLVRSRYGIFDLNGAISLEQLEEASRRGSWQSLLYPIDSVLAHWPMVALDGEMERDVRCGRTLDLGNSVDNLRESRCRAYALDGCFLGVLRFNPESGRWQPEKVFVTQASSRDLT